MIPVRWVAILCARKRGPFFVFSTLCSFWPSPPPMMGASGIAFHTAMYNFMKCVHYREQVGFFSHLDCASPSLARQYPLLLIKQATRHDPAKYSIPEKQGRENRRTTRKIDLELAVATTIGATRLHLLITTIACMGIDTCKVGYCIQATYF